MIVEIPADVPTHKEADFKANFLQATGGSGRLMLFAGDQKVEHLNNDFYGEGIPLEDNHPEHLFKIADRANIGVFATHYGLIARYAKQYPTIPYLVKLNAKTNLVPYEESAPYSKQWLGIKEVIQLKKEHNLNILGVGYTLYLGGEHEHAMLQEAAQIIHQAHAEGLITVLWIYPKGKYVSDEHDAHLIAGAAGVGVSLGADFIKLKVPYHDNLFNPHLLEEITQAAGNAGVLCEGGDRVGKEQFLRELHAQIHIGHARGNGTGRNIHQRILPEAIHMANAIYAITVENATVEEAMQIASQIDKKERI